MLFHAVVLSITINQNWPSTFEVCIVNIWSECTVEFLLFWTCHWPMLSIPGKGSLSLVLNNCSQNWFLNLTIVLAETDFKFSYEYFFVTQDSTFVWKCALPKRIEISQDRDGRLFCILIRPTKPNDIKWSWAKFVRQTSDEIKQKQLCLPSCREIILPYEISTSLWCQNTAPIALLFQIIVQPLISAKILMQWMEFAVQIDIT